MNVRIPVATGEAIENQGVLRGHAMSGLLFLLIFFALLGAASAVGLTADSRERGDWSPSDQGRRCTQV